MKEVVKSIKTIAVIFPLSIALELSSVTSKLNVSVDVSSIGYATLGSY